MKNRYSVLQNLKEDFLQLLFKNFKFLIPIGVLLFLFNCDKSVTHNNNKNDLLPETIFVIDKIFNDKTELIQNKYFIDDKIFFKYFNEIIIKYPERIFEVGIIDLNKPDAIDFKGDIYNSPKIKDLSNVLLYENWHYNDSLFCFKKIVRAIAPIKDTVNRSNEKVKKIMFWVVQNNNVVTHSEEKLIDFVSDVEHEYQIDNGIIGNFNKDIFFDKLFEKIVQRGIPIYDYYTKEEIDLTKLKKNMGFGGEQVWYRDSLSRFLVYKIKNDWSNEEFLNYISYDEIKSILFIEDWYINQENMQFIKRVKKICLVRHITNEFSEVTKKIVLEIKLNNSEGVFQN